jgi:thioredoxin 1
MVKLSNYNEFLREIKDGRCVVEFSSNDCPPCKALKPILEEIESEIKEIKFFEVNISESKDISDKMTIFGVPTLMFVSEGKEIKRMVGFANRKKILKTLKGVFK